MVFRVRSSRKFLAVTEGLDVSSTPWIDRSVAASRSCDQDLSRRCIDPGALAHCTRTRDRGFEMLIDSHEQVAKLRIPLTARDNNLCRSLCVFNNHNNS